MNTHPDPTRDEAIAAARQEGAEAMRAAILNAPHIELSRYQKGCIDAVVLPVAPRTPTPCDCSECGGTHRVVSCMGVERACDYCGCVP